MSKQHISDRGSKDVFSLLVTDSSFDSLTDNSSVLYERVFTTHRVLQREEEKQLLGFVQKRTEELLRPGLAVTLVTNEKRPCEYTFLVTAS